MINPFTKAALLNSMFGKTSTFGALATPPAIYVGLSSTTPGLDGSFNANGITEPSGGSYARVATTSSDWGAATEGNNFAQVANVNTITFPTATADWSGGANMTYAIFYDAPTGGNVLGVSALATSQAVLNGQQASFAGGNIVWKIT